MPSILLSLLAIVVSSAHIARASPLPQDEFIIERQNSTLELRQCAVLCGYYNQVTCGCGQACTTIAGEASCAAAAVAATVTSAGSGNGQWQWFTSTYVETDLVTVVTTFSSFVVAPTTAYVTPVQTQVVVTTVVAPVPVQTVLTCATNQACGNICCASDQFCAYSGQCSALEAASTANNVVSTLYLASTVVESTASAFIRPTSNSILTVTSTGTATTTIPFQTPIGTDGSSLTGITATQQSSGLSGGAIAGIVIGVLVLIFILFLICACCLAKGLIDTVLGCFGLGPRSRRRVTDTTVVEEHHSRHSGRVQNGGRTWYGTRINGQDANRKSSGWGGALGVGAALAALAVVLGIRRRNERKEDKTEYTGSSYSYSYDTSESSASTQGQNRRDSRRGGSRR
ncbi:hypothetical protein MMC11_003113 [Xylographa trunciseda]|nr:hypothetical protein [Xylographa trunciseda]